METFEADPGLKEKIAQRAAELFTNHRRKSFEMVDRMFAWLMVGQWVFAVAMAIYISPYAWTGKVKAIHTHVYLAVFLGGAISLLPLVLIRLRPGRAYTRHVVAVSQVLWSALLIHLSGGRIETHFHVFASLAALAFYRDWRVLVSATVVVAADHLARGLVFPESVYGVVNPEWWRFLEHAGWVLFEDAFLATACISGVEAMTLLHTRQAQVELFSERLERRVEERTAELEEAQEIAHLGSWSWDPDSDTVSWSNELYRVFGLEKSALRATFDGILALIHPDDRQIVSTTVHAAVADRRPFEIEHRIVRPSGEVRTVQARGRVITDGGRIRLRGTAVDVTEYKQLQTRLVFADRMTSVGTLAAGVAHEINNPLAYVLSNLDYVSRAVPKVAARVADPECAQTLRDVADALSEARDGAGRVRNIVRDLKTFARSDEERRGPVEVRPVLESAINMAWNEIRHRARLVKDFGDVPPVEGNESRLCQVFLNLLVNAAQALPEGGADKHEIKVTTRMSADGRVVAEVRDTGGGIPAQVRDRIFDPFFTTKPIGVGTGLGLSICHSIVTAMGGEISVDSQPGQGTVFRVVLPPSRAQAGAETPRSAAESGNRVRVLIVDDEPLILAGLRRLMTSHHQVVTATSGREALDRIARGETFDVVLCDLMMPEMTGIRLHEEMKRIAPEQARRTIFMTGGTFTLSAREFLDKTENPCLEKPVDAEALFALIRTQSAMVS